MPKGVVVLLLPVMLFLGACGNTPSTPRSDVERGTALPPPGLNGTATVRR